MFANAIHRGLCEEYGEMFRGKAALDPDLQEMAAQFRIELDSGPTAARLRKMWAAFSNDRTLLDPVLPGSEHKSYPPDQTHRELVAFETSLRMCREIHGYRNVERSRQNNPEPPGYPDPKQPFSRPVASSPSNRPGDEETAWWKNIFTIFVLRGGHLLNPLIGFVVGAVVFVAYIKEVGDIPAGLFLALLSGLVTTFMLSLFGATHEAENFTSDNSFSSLERTLPVLLHRIEAAGLFPIIIVDELDKLEDEQTGKDQDSSVLGNHIAKFARDLKYFVAEQAFVCFLAPRRFYEEVHRDSFDPTAKRSSLDTFFTDRILVSHRPTDLLSYLDLRLTLPSSNNNDAMTLEFLKHWHLFRAYGNLGNLQDCISAEQTSDGYVYLANAPLTSVPAYRDHVLFQLAVEGVLNADKTEELLRQHPDLLEPLNQALYNAARHWEHGYSFTLLDLVDATSARSDETRIDFKAQLDIFVNYLISEEEVNPRLFNPRAQVVQKLYQNFEPLLERSLKHTEARYFWRRSFTGSLRPAHHDAPTEPKLRSARERDLAILDIRGLANLLFALGKITPFDISYPMPLLDYAPPDLSWESFSWRMDSATRDERAIAELHQAMLRNSRTLRNILLLEILGQSGNPGYSLSDLESTLQVFQDPSARNWTGMMEVTNARRKRVLTGATVPHNLRESFELMTAIATSEIARWSAEGQTLLSRIRRL